MYDEIIKICSKLYGVDEKLILAIIKTESSGNPWAFRIERGFWSRYFSGIKAIFLRTPEKDEKWLTYPDIVSASYGLMQVMLTTAMERGFRFIYPFELFRPATNIKWGCAHLKYLYDRYKDWDTVIAAYNQGDDRRRPDGKFKNQEYVDKVKQFMGEYQ